ncbi:tyrosine-type recombinase/integrase, partial [Bacteroides clarus]
SQYFVFFCRSVCSANLAKCLIINVLRLIIVILFFIAFLNITYVARHTFATTVYLCNGGTIEALSKILGHKHISTTQIYAEVTNKMVSSDFRSISGNLAAMQKKVLDRKQKKVSKQQAVAMRETA